MFDRNPKQDRSRGQALAEFALVAPLLFLLLIGIFEAGRYVLFTESLNNATREGARFAIVHGDNAACPTGPLSPPATYDDYGGCSADTSGTRVKQAVVDSAPSLAAMGELFVHDPMWASHGDFSPPERGDVRGVDYTAGFNTRGDYVTVFVDYTYSPIFATVLGNQLIPSITISAESSLVINY